MKPRSKINKVIDIVLFEEKFYFPGETIRGSVIVRPKSSIKVNQCLVKFQGSIFIAGKEKEVIPLFLEKKCLPVNNGKSKILEVKQYNFPFEFVVPDNLPSVFDLAKNKTTKIHYKISALLDKHMVPESLCPKTEYPVLILEYIDVTKDKFTKPLEIQKECITVQNGKCLAKLSIPRSGFTRGETIPIKIVVNTYSSLVEQDVLVVELVRKISIQSNKNTIEDESILKKSSFNLNIIGPYNFTQSTNGQIMIPTTPPTICYNDKTLNVSYKIRATVLIGNGLVVELPVVIGTWPRADIPIDDDDEDEIIQNMSEIMISDESDNEDSWEREREELKRDKNSHQTHRQIRRSGSNGSLGSMLSWNTQSTTDHRNSGFLTLSSSTTSSSLASPISITSNTDSRALMLTPIHKDSLTRPSTTLELLVNPPPPPPTPLSNKNRPKVIDPLLRASFYGSEAFPHVSNLPVTTQNEVPTRTLTFLSSNTGTPPQTVAQHEPLAELSSGSSSDDSDFDEDDLLAIIERKKKKEEKEMKRRQRLLYV